MVRAYAERGFQQWLVRMVIGTTHYVIASFDYGLFQSETKAKMKAFEVAQKINNAAADAGRQ